MLVDDHPVVRDGYRHMLDNSPDIRVSPSGRRGDRLRLLREHKPDVVILD